MSKYKNVIIVNDKDEVIGAMNMIEAKNKNILRRAVRVFVFNKRGQILLQRRSKDVFHPLLLDQSVGGHVDEGETYQIAAAREMKEELGIEPPFLEEIIVSYRTRCHFNAIYRTVIDNELSIPFNTKEVSEVIWFKPIELTEKIIATPEEFTESFLIIWQELRDKIIPS